MRRWIQRLLVAASAAVAACAGLWVWYCTRDYGGIFLQQKGNLVAHRPAGTEDVVLLNDRGLSVEVRMRLASEPGTHPGVLLAVGLETGKRVINLLEPREDIVVLAVDYGWQGEFDIRTAPKMLQSVGRMRRLSMETVPRLLLALEFLGRQPQVDTNRLVVVGVSYGSYFALPAAALEPRVDELILVQGGGELGQTIVANAELWRPPLPPRAAGWLGESLFLPFQPERWIQKIAPRPVTFIASRTDPALPAAAVEKVYARARPPRKLLWHDTPHVAPSAAEIIAELSRIVLEQLGQGVQ